MANRNLNENINQAIADFKSIKQAIADKGVDIPTGTPTSEYGAKIGEIQTGGGGGEIEKGFIPTETNADGYAIKGILKGMTTVPNRFFYCYSSSLSSASGFSYLTDVIFEKPIISIGQSVFHNCASLSFTYLPESITSINSSAFAYCEKLALTYLPSGLTTIGSSAFHSCKKIKLTYLPNGITDIPNMAFYDCQSITLTYLPDGIVSIATNAFYNCTKLTALTIGSAITSIGSTAFRSCTNLKSITINKPSGSISGSPWGATNATVTWTG